MKLSKFLLQLILLLALDLKSVQASPKFDIGLVVVPILVLVLVTVPAAVVTLSGNNFLEPAILAGNSKI